MKRMLAVCGAILLCWTLAAQKHISIDHPESWTTGDMSAYVGQEVIFDEPLVICSNVQGYGEYNGTVTVSPRRTFAPTNQARPKTPAYNSVVTLNGNGSMTLSGLGKNNYHRNGEKVYNLHAKVNSRTSLTYIDGEWRGNTRAELEAGIPADELGDYSLLVCTMNLEYYLTVPNTSTSSTMGPHTYAEHQKQRTKIQKALAKINADIFGFVEIESGDSALAEIARDLTRNTGRPFTYIHDGTGINGTYTKAGFVYCTDAVETVGALQSNGKVSNNRSQLQCFRELASGEKFLFSVNHFKAKSGSGTGLEADQGDGQGQYNHKRTEEAESVISQYNRFKTQIKDKDLLIMGDLNAYGKEDPIIKFLDAGFTDLHRAFHADSSYSYSFSGQVGYLDHAIASPTMYMQVTGMVGYHINSDESDQFTYDKSDDQTMFRCSDHDPVLIGLRLDNIPDYSADPYINAGDYGKDSIILYNTYDAAYPNSYFALHTVSGTLICPPTPIQYASTPAPGATFVLSADNEDLPEEVRALLPLQSGSYILTIYARGNVYTQKLIVL